MAKWSLDLSKYCEQQKDKINDVRKKVMFKLYDSIVEKTPVKTGRARGNWNISVGSDDETIKENQITPQYKSVDDVPEVKDDESIFISNNLPYIQKLEYGSSKQAPDGMVGLTLARFQRIVDESTKK